MLSKRMSKYHESEYEESIAASDRDLADTLAYPCSAGQRHFWILDQLSPGDPSLNIAWRWRLEGTIGNDDLQVAFNTIIARHEPLRTFFEWDSSGPVQMVGLHLPFHIPMIDITGLPAAEAVAEAERIAQAEARASFDLSAPPLIRVTHLRLAKDLSLILVTVHRIVCDNGSLGILAREIGEICAARQAARVIRLPELSICYGEYSSRESLYLEGPEFRTAAEFWIHALKGAKQLEIHADHVRPAVQTNNHQMMSVPLRRQLTDDLALRSSEQGCSLFVVSLSAFVTLLYRYTGETDISVGTQSDEREDREFENMVGPLTNTLIIRSDLSGDPIFTDLLKRVGKTVTDAYDHRYMPLEKLIEILKPQRDLSRNALFSINFTFQRCFTQNDRYGSFRLIDTPSCSTGTRCDLNVAMVESFDGWRLSCEFNSDLFEEGTITRFLKHLEVLLEAVAAEPHRKLSALPILSPAERHEIVVGWNRTQAVYPDGSTLVQLFAAQAARSPGSIAAICGDRTMNYEELDLASARIARHLSSLGIGPRGLVGVLLERSIDLVVALLGILRSGHAYVPMDPAFPAERLHQVAEDAGLSALITRPDLGRRLFGASPTFALVDIALVAVDPPSGAAVIAATPQDIAYVIYTSGSTGRPKGVQISHRALVNLLWSMLDRPGLGALDTMLCVTTISFDIAAMEVFLPLIVGAKVVLATETEVTDGIALQQLLIRHRVSVMQATPATWQLLLESGWRGDADLKMLCGGEALSRTLAERLLRCKGELWNMYGPTETTIWSSALRVESAEGPVLLGGPIANTQFYVLDSHGELAPPGAPGELYIGGDGVALGYQGMPALTRERFLPDKFSGGLEGRIYRTGDMVRIRQPGLIEYLGRTDQQIKLRGFRIELGEIESVLRRQGNIADAVATKGLDGAGEDAILAYVVLRGDSGSRADDAVVELRAKLSSALPAYMIPSSITLLDALPRTPNGKIDRRALPAPALISLQRSESAVSLNAVERRLSEIWASLLGVEHIGATEDFFELGGHSLLAARLIARIESEFGKRFSLVTLFRAPTIKAQAKLLEHGDPREFVFRQVVRVHPNGSKLPLIAINNTGVYYYNLAKSLGPDYPLLALQLFDPSLPQRMLPKTLEQIAAEYVGLIRQYQPTGPYQLIGWCVGGILAFEIACQLRQSGQEVSLLALIDTWVPGYMKRAPRWRAMLADYSYRCQLIWADWIKVMSGTSGMRQFLANRTLIKKIRHWYGSSAVDELSAAASQEEGKSDAERYDQWLLGYLEETAQQYQAKPYDGKVTLLCSASEPRGLFLDPKMGWGAYAAGGVEVDIIEGDHFSIFHDPGIGQMARSLSAVGKSVCETRFPLAG